MLYRRFWHESVISKISSLHETIFFIVLLIFTWVTQANALSSLYTVCETTTDLTTLINDLDTIKSMNIDVVIPYSHAAGNAWRSDAEFVAAMNSLMDAATNKKLKIIVDLTRYTQYQGMSWGFTKNTPNLADLTTFVSAVKTPRP